MSRRSAIEKLGEDASVLVNSTKAAVGEGVKEAERMAGSTLRRGEQLCGRVRQQVTSGATSFHKTVMQYPYYVLAVGFGIGVLLTILLSRKRRGICFEPRDGRSENGSP